MKLWILIRRLRLHTPMEPIDKIVTWAFSKKKIEEKHDRYSRRNTKLYWYWIAEVNNN